jgi:integrase
MSYDALVPPPDPESTNTRSGAAALWKWAEMAQAAFSPNTIRAWKADWELFSEFCHKCRLPVLPAAAKTVRYFVFECVGLRKKPATIRRYVATIGRAHRAAGVPDATVSEEVKLSLTEMSRGMAARQRQARGLVWSEIAVFLEFQPRNLRDIRDRALVAVAYDTMCRREELVSLLIEDIEPAGDGSGTVVIRRAKTDVTGEGATAYLSPLSMRLLSEWLQGSGLKSGPLFARVVGSNGIGDPLTAQIVSAVLRKVGQWIGLDRREWERISGHSARVGARPRPAGAECRSTIRDASRALEGHAHADALRRASSCGKRRHGEGGESTGACMRRSPPKDATMRAKCINDATLILRGLFQ